MNLSLAPPPQDDIDFLFTEKDIEEFEGFIREAEGLTSRSETL